MTELEKLERARMYLDKLANGIDPLTDEELPEDTVLNNVRLARCFFYSADVLRRVIENGGKIAAPKKPKRADFNLTPEQIAELKTTATPLTISELVEKMNSVIDLETTKKISTTAITKWLLNKGFLQEVVNEDGGKSRLPTAMGLGIGLSNTVRSTLQGTYTVVLYNRDAQMFVIDNLAAITEPEEKAK